MYNTSETFMLNIYIYNIYRDYIWRITAPERIASLYYINNIITTVCRDRHI